MDLQGIGQRLRNRAFASIAGFTIVLTAAFVGLVALLSGDSSGASDRFPYYVLAFAVAFLLALWQLDDERRDGRMVLIAITGIAVGSSLLFGLAVEGVAHASADPASVFNTHMLVYFLSAAIICTGIGIWGFRHWREFARAESLESA